MEQLITDIKQNCDISDASYWGYFSICGLLMRYRDLFRSERGLDPWSPIPQQDITAWIEEKESRWPSLEGRDFGSLVIAGRVIDPFDSGQVNSLLNREGLAYGAGYGAFLKPTFLLAEIQSVSETEGHRVYVTGRERVRDLFTAPAMLQGRTILLRREAIRTLLWDFYTQLRPGRASLMADAFHLHGLEPGRSGGPDLSGPLEQMVDAYARVLLRHELAESRESLPAWKSLLAAGLDRTTELILRAVQDLIADTSSAGPLQESVKNRDRTGLVLTVGLMERFRLSLAAELRSAYDRFGESGDWSVMEEARAALFERFRSVRERALVMFDQGDHGSFGARLQRLVQDRS